MKTAILALALCVCAFGESTVQILPAGPPANINETLGSFTIPLPPGYKQTTFVTFTTTDARTAGFKAVISYKDGENIAQTTVYHDLDHFFEGKRSGTAWANVSPGDVIDVAATPMVEADGMATWTKPVARLNRRSIDEFGFIGTLPCPISKPSDIFSCKDGQTLVYQKRARVTDGNWQESHPERSTLGTRGEPSKRLSCDGTICEPHPVADRRGAGPLLIEAFEKAVGGRR